MVWQIENCMAKAKDCKKIHSTFSDLTAILCPNKGSHTKL